MNEQRITAYYQLSQKLLECSNEEEMQILTAHSDLLDIELLQIIILLAKRFNDSAYKNSSYFLTNLALQLGKILSNKKQKIEIRKQTGDILFKWGNEQFHISQFIIACQCWEHCLSIYQDINHHEGEMNSFGNLGNFYRSIGEYQRAIAFYRKSLAISQDIKHLEGKANSLGGLGIAYECLGEYKQAINVHQQSVAIYREIKDPKGEAASLGNLGNIYQSLGEYEQSISFSKDSLEIYQEIKDFRG